MCTYKPIFCSKIAPKAYPMDTLPIIFLQKIELFSVCEMCSSVSSYPESQFLRARVVRCRANFWRALALGQGLDRLNEKSFAWTFLQFKTIPVLRWSNQDLVGGLELLGFVCIKSERPNHRTAALRSEATNLRNTPKSLAWSNRVLAALQRSCTSHSWATILLNYFWLILLSSLDVLLNDKTTLLCTEYKLNWICYPVVPNFLRQILGGKTPGTSYKNLNEISKNHMMKSRHN